MKKRRTISVVIVVFYLIITSAIGLFHDDDCLFGASDEDTTKGLSSCEQCPACMFSASFNSTEAYHELPQLTTEDPIFCPPTQHFMVANHHEWAYSILLRGPPLTFTS